MNQLASLVLLYAVYCTASPADADSSQHLGNHIDFQEQDEVSMV